MCIVVLWKRWYYGRGGAVAGRGIFFVSLRLDIVIDLVDYRVAVYCVACEYSLQWVR